MAFFFALSIVILLLSVIIHEVAHGLAARYWGDYTAENAGRLTLNPIAHIDPVGTILVPLITYLAGGVLFGWAKPVPINPYNFRNLKQGMLWVSSAGILANIALAALAAILYHLLPPAPYTLYPSLLRFTVQINSVLAVFNLLPIAPLDGSKVLIAVLPPHLARQVASLERYGFVILLALMFIPVGGTNLLGLILGVVLSVIHTILGV